MRKKIAAGNWKMNLEHDEAMTLAQSVLSSDIKEGVDIIIGSPFVYLKELVDMCSNTDSISVAAQNCHQLASGAYTGEVSAGMLRSIDVSHVIVGHSERRSLFGETDEILKHKLDAVLEQGLTAIFCCGEALEIREANSQNGFVSQQLVHSLFHLPAEAFERIIIAYEPIWAIGTGRTASPEQAQEMHAFIRSLVREKYSEEIAEKLSILYGGSVKPDNAAELFGMPDVDGGLVGGASLDAEGFVRIANSF